VQRSPGNRFFDFLAKKRLPWLLAVCFLGLGLDQASKHWAQSSLAEPYHLSEEEIVDNKTVSIQKEVYYPIRVVEVIPSVLNLIYKENPAAAFSLTHSIPVGIRRPLLISVSIIATFFFLFWYFRKNVKDGLLLGSFSFILTGAIGNLLDRIRLGYVIDFIDVHAAFLGYPHMHWPTFNIADSFIVTGAIGVVICTLWPFVEPKQNQNAAP
jgi:signal peptidase II